MTNNAYVMSFMVNSRVQHGELHDWSMNSIFKTVKWSPTTFGHIMLKACSCSWAFLCVVEFSWCEDMNDFFFFQLWLLEMGHEQQHCWQPVATNITRNNSFVFSSVYCKQQVIIIRSIVYIKCLGFMQCCLI